MITILHATEDHSPRNTGITSAVDTLVRQLIPVVRQEIVCVGPDTIKVPDEVAFHAFETRGLGAIWRMAPGQYPRLQEHIARANVVHLHGLWMWIQWASAREAQKLSIPFVVTPHGMLAPWIWERQIWPHQLKKHLYWHGIAYPTFRHASVIHAITPQEANHLSGYFPGQRLEVIPHGLDVASIDIILSKLICEPAYEKPYILFLGRLSSVKGIDLLIQSFASLPGMNFKLKIAGPVLEREKKYTESLHKFVEQSGLQQRVEFLGPVQGEEKWRLYRQAWVVCQPSFSEVLSMVNLEAATCQTPVITTQNTGIVESWGKEGGILTQAEVPALTTALCQAASWSAVERDERGKSLRALVERTYSWRVISPQWISLYQGLAGQ